MNGFTLLGLSRPSGPTIFGHHAPRTPCAFARASRHRQLRQVERHAALEQLGPAPHGEMRGMTRVHLEMELAVPAVGEQPLFLRRQAARAVDRP